MPKCRVKECDRLTRFNRTKNRYCVMHLARICRHGYPELKRDRGEHGLEKLPHAFIDDFILSNCSSMIDAEIAKELRKRGYKGANEWNVKYRRRKLGKRKYLSGEVLKHKAWIRAQAIKRYGHACELCGFSQVVDAHHVVAKHKGGPHEVENLMIVCPNCHALITRKMLEIKDRTEIPTARKHLREILR